MTAPAWHNVAIVTGAAGGLGQVIARRLAADGFRVLLTDIDGDAAARVADAIGGDVAAQAIDVRDPAQFETAFAAATARWGGVGVLVNNAALTRTTPLFDISPEEFDAVTAVALKGCFLGCQTAGRHMRAQRYGRIVNIASLAGKEGTPTLSAYSAAKAGVIAFTKAHGKELAGTGVLVNAVAPAAVETELLQQMSAETVATMIGKSPLKRLGTVDELAELVAWLASERCSFSTGAVFDLSGGRATY